MDKPEPMKPVVGQWADYFSYGPYKLDDPERDPEVEKALFPKWMLEQLEELRKKESH